jgi:hypothetical protein
MRRMVLAILATAAIAVATATLVVALAPQPTYRACPAEPSVAPVVVAPPAPPAPPFDLLACATDLGPGELAPERGGPPPTMTRFPLHARAELEAAARKIAAALPWHAHVELDATGMGKSVELHLAKNLPPSEDVRIALDVVRAHPCLFGVVAPTQLAAHATGPNHDGGTVLFDVSPRQIGALAARVELEGRGEVMRIDLHLWPVADRQPALDPTRAFARYLGRRYTRHEGWHYLVDRHTLRHTGCVPIVRERVSDVSSLSWQAGPLLACRGRFAEVEYGAFVWSPGYAGGDERLAELPKAVLPDGTLMPAPWIAPGLRAPDGDDPPADVGDCPSPE